MNTADKFESARKVLGWSFEDLATKLGKYTPEFLERVHRGEPMPQVEDDLNKVYMEALAKKAVNSFLRKKFPDRVRTGLNRRFVRFARRKNLALDDVIRLSLRVSEGSFRELLTKDPDAIVVNWEGILEDIVREFKQTAQGSLFESGPENAVGNTDSEISLITNQVNRVPESLVLAVCDYCGEFLSENQRDRCYECGRPNSRYL